MEKTLHYILKEDSMTNKNWLSLALMKIFQTNNLTILKRFSLEMAF